MLLDLAERYGFSLRVCQPYRAQTKGKVERFNRYLKSSFVVPLTATFNQAGLVLDVESANARIGAWLCQVANVRVHGTTGEVPQHRLEVERKVLLPLPLQESHQPCIPPCTPRPLPKESLLHPLSLYQAIVEGHL